MSSTPAPLVTIVITGTGVRDSHGGVEHHNSARVRHHATERSEQPFPECWDKRLDEGAKLKLKAEKRDFPEATSVCN